jgi:formyl-CoA transferase
MAGMLCALGVMTAIYNRDVVGSGEGQVVDMSLYESVFRCMEGTVADYGMNNVVRERTGNRHPLTTPGEHYMTKDGKWMVLASANDRVFERFAKAIGREDLLQDSRFAKQANRSKTENKDILEAITSKWIALVTVGVCKRKILIRIAI